MYNQLVHILLEDRDGMTEVVGVYLKLEDAQSAMRKEAIGNCGLLETLEVYDTMIEGNNGISYSIEQSRLR